LAADAVQGLPYLGLGIDCVPSGCRYGLQVLGIRWLRQGWAGACVIGRLGLVLVGVGLVGRDALRCRIEPWCWCVLRLRLRHILRGRLGLGLARWIDQAKYQGAACALRVQ
jgi:hypothetical protein